MDIRQNNVHRSSCYIAKMIGKPFIRMHEYLNLVSGPSLLNPSFSTLFCVQLALKSWERGPGHDSVMLIKRLLILTASMSIALLRACAASSCVTSIKLTPSQTRIWSPTFSFPYRAAAPPSRMREMIMAPPRGVSVPPRMASLMGPF